jgi:hypothetical protein
MCKRELLCTLAFVVPFAWFIHMILNILEMTLGVRVPGLEREMRFTVIRFAGVVIGVVVLYLLLVLLYSKISRRTRSETSIPLLCLLASLIPLAMLIDEILYLLGISGPYWYQPIPTLVFTVLIVAGVILGVIIVYQILRDENRLV